VGTADDQAEIEADYAMDADVLDLSISADSMDVSTLRAQVSLAAVPWLEQLQSGRWSGQLHYRRQPPAPPPAKPGWTGTLDVRDAKVAVPGLADPLQLLAAHAQIDGARVTLDHVTAQAGKLAFTGDYRYEPSAAHPHRVHLHAGEIDAADLESEFAPTMRRNPGLLAQALGRSALPEWLQQRGVEGSVSIDDLSLAGFHFEGVRTRLVWVGDRVDLDGIQASLDRAVLTGRLAVSLHSAHPSYRLTAKLKGLGYLTGKLDAEGTVQSFGSGTQLLTNLTSEGSFTGTGWDLGSLTSYRSVGGSYHMTWAPAGPRLHFTDLNLRDSDDTYTGNGATQENGHVIVLLTNGSREMRVIGPLAKLRVEEGAR
jgi:hypothetical protein